MKRPSAAAVVSTGVVTDGVIRLDDKVTTAAELKTVRNGGIVLTVEPAGERAMRVVKMLRYYRGMVVRAFVDASLKTPEAVHAVLTARFLGRPVEMTSTVTGEVFTGLVIPSTGDLDPDDLWTYIEQCRAFCLEQFKVRIPDPDPAWKLHREVA